MFSMYIVVLAIAFILAYSVTAYPEETTGTATMTRQDRLTGTLEKPDNTLRLLRSGDTGDDTANGNAYNEERASVYDTLLRLPVYKLGLKVALQLKHTPAKVLQTFEKIGIPPTVEVVLLWIRYVQKYRAKVGTSTVDDAFVVKTLKEFVSPKQLPMVFKAMEKNPQLQSYGKQLQKLSANSA
ncbi:RxLR effector protein [Phytophthora megakarya]|uniref:RxLR effector protein n=1 Tax=Phytophthora megakarya TaxID=4795 RepID=A0A225WT94_9STRA|nr:RxLR effector protein [Phytophthora megakarya]